MRFKNKEQEVRGMMEAMGLILSGGAVFFQIWILSSAISAWFEGSTHGLAASVVFSGSALLICLLAAWTTTLDFSRGLTEGRTESYIRVTQDYKGKGSHGTN